MPYKLSPNEAERLYKEEVERRRKQRLVQVREIAKRNASKIRDAVRKEKEKQLNKLADKIATEWQLEKAEELRRLQNVYDANLRTVGQSHQAAKDFDPKYEEQVIVMLEDQKRAEERQLAALQKLRSDRETRTVEEYAHIFYRKSALQLERVRASRIASLPPPPPDPVRNLKEPRHKPVRVYDATSFSHTMHHMQDFAVERADEADGQNAKMAAQEEELRIEERRELDKKLRQETLEKARLRHNHARRKELLKQDYDQLLLDLSELQRADKIRRSQMVSHIPKNIFNPPHQRLDQKTEQQRNMEEAFENMYLAATDFCGDLSLALDPQQPPVRPSLVDDLDVTPVPSDEDTPTRDNDEKANKPVPLKEVTNIVAGSPKTSGEKVKEKALKKLMSRIHKQRKEWEEVNQTELTPIRDEAPVAGLPRPSPPERESLSTEETVSGQHPISDGLLSEQKDSPLSVYTMSSGSQSTATSGKSDSVIAGNDPLLHPIEQAERLRRGTKHQSVADSQVADKLAKAQEEQESLQRHIQDMEKKLDVLRARKQTIEEHDTFKRQRPEMTDNQAVASTSKAPPYVMGDLNETPAVARSHRPHEILPSMAISTSMSPPRPTLDRSLGQERIRMPSSGWTPDLPPGPGLHKAKPQVFPESDYDEAPSLDRQIAEQASLGKQGRSTPGSLVEAMPPTVSQPKRNEASVVRESRASRDRRVTEQLKEQVHPGSLNQHITVSTAEKLNPMPSTFGSSGQVAIPPALPTQGPTFNKSPAEHEKSSPVEYNQPVAEMLGPVKVRPAVAASSEQNRAPSMPTTADQQRQSFRSSSHVFGRGSSEFFPLTSIFDHESQSGQGESWSQQERIALRSSPTRIISPSQSPLLAQRYPGHGDITDDRLPLRPSPTQVLSRAHETVSQISQSQSLNYSQQSSPNSGSGSTTELSMYSVPDSHLSGSGEEMNENHVTSMSSGLKDKTQGSGPLIGRENYAGEVSHRPNQTVKGASEPRQGRLSNDGLFNTDISFTQGRLSRADQSMSREDQRIVRQSMLSALDAINASDVRVPTQQARASFPAAASERREDSNSNVWRSRLLYDRVGSVANLSQRTALSNSELGGQLPIDNLAPKEHLSEPNWRNRDLSAVGLEDFLDPGRNQGDGGQTRRSASDFNQKQEELRSEMREFYTLPTDSEDEKAVMKDTKPLTDPAPPHSSPPPISHDYMSPADRQRLLQSLQSPGRFNRHQDELRSQMRAMQFSHLKSDDDDDNDESLNDTLRESHIGPASSVPPTKGRLPEEKLKGDQNSDKLSDVELSPPEFRPLPGDTLAATLASLGLRQGTSPPSEESPVLLSSPQIFPSSPDLEALAQRQQEFDLRRQELQAQLDEVRHQKEELMQKQRRLHTTVSWSMTQARRPPVAKHMSAVTDHEAHELSLIPEVETPQSSYRASRLDDSRLSTRSLDTTLSVSMRPISEVSAPFTPGIARKSLWSQSSANGDLTQRDGSAQRLRPLEADVSESASTSQNDQSELTQLPLSGRYHGSVIDQSAVSQYSLPQSDSHPRAYSAPLFEENDHSRLSSRAKPFSVPDVDTSGWLSSPENVRLPEPSPLPFRAISSSPNSVISSPNMTSTPGKFFKRLEASNCDDMVDPEAEKGITDEPDLTLQSLASSLDPEELKPRESELGDVRLSKVPVVEKQVEKPFLPDRDTTKQVVVHFYDEMDSHTPSAMDMNDKEVGATTKQRNSVAVSHNPEGLLDSFYHGMKKHRVSDEEYSIRQPIHLKNMAIIPSDDKQHLSFHSLNDNRSARPNSDSLVQILTKHYSSPSLSHQNVNDSQNARHNSSSFVEMVSSTDSASLYRDFMRPTLSKSSKALVVPPKQVWTAESQGNKSFHGWDQSYSDSQLRIETSVKTSNLANAEVNTGERHSFLNRGTQSGSNISKRHRTIKVHIKSPNLFPLEKNADMQLGKQEENDIQCTKLSSARNETYQSSLNSHSSGSKETNSNFQSQIPTQSEASGVVPRKIRSLRSRDVEPSLHQDTAVTSATTKNKVTTYGRPVPQHSIKVPLGDMPQSPSLPSQKLLMPCEDTCVENKSEPLLTCNSVAGNSEKRDSTHGVDPRQNCDDSDLGVVFYFGKQQQQPHQVDRATPHQTDIKKPGFDSKPALRFSPKAGTEFKGTTSVHMQSQRCDSQLDEKTLAHASAAESIQQDEQVVKYGSTISCNKEGFTADGNNHCLQSSGGTVVSKLPRDGNSLLDSSSIRDEKITHCNLPASPEYCDERSFVSMQNDSLASFEQHERSACTQDSVPFHAEHQDFSLVEFPDKSERQPSLQEALLKKNPKFFKQAEKRRRKLNDPEHKKKVHEQVKAKTNAVQLTSTITSWMKLRSNPGHKVVSEQRSESPEVVSSAERKQKAKVNYSRSNRLYNQLEEVKKKQQDKERKEALMLNRQRRKEFEMKLAAKRKRSREPT